jgi:hypothetical protein
MMDAHRPLAIAWRTWALALAAIWMCPRPALGFEYGEHCRVSNDGLTRAVAVTGLAVPDRPGSPGVGVVSTVSPCTGKLRKREGPVSYGDLVGLADSVLSPLDFYVGEPNPDAAAAFDASRPPAEVVDRLAPNWVQGLFAAHNNEDHFHERVAFAYWFWHARAVELARSGNLGTAMVVNAYADHFLEDSFAPGHLRTPRHELHDAVTIGMHGYYNNQAAACRLSHRDELSLLATGPERDRLREIEQVLMKGDGHLEEDADRYLVVALIVARSIADVLESAATGTAVNHFVEYRFRGYEADADGQRLTPALATRYAEFPPTRTADPLRFDPTLGVTLGAQSFFGRNAAPSLGAFGAELLVTGSAGHGWRSRGSRLPQFGLTVGYGLRTGGRTVVHSPGARLVFPVTRLDLQLSVTAARSFYNQGRLEGAAWDFGVRVEMGFGLVFLGIGVERGHSFSGAGGLRPAAVLTTAASFALPLGSW